MVAKKIDIIAIAGPTATGKTSLAIAIAKEYNGEVIAVDSRTIYKDLNIGTAKPTKVQQDSITHWGLDLITPDQSYSAAQFKDYADNAIKDILSRGKTPILVGGTGLYMDGVLYDFSFSEPDYKLREELNLMTIEQLQARITEEGIGMPNNMQNKLHLITAIERKGKPTERKKIRDNVLFIGLSPDRVFLRKVVKSRLQQMLDDGAMEEIKQAGERYGWDAPGMSAGIYKVMRPVFEGQLSMDEAFANAITSDMRLAKRQITWLKRNPDITWFADTRDAKKWLITQLGVK